MTSPPTEERNVERLRKMARASEARLVTRIAAAQASGFELDPPTADEIDRHAKLLIILENMEALERLREMTREG
jgi:hypothetical protein